MPPTPNHLDQKVGKDFASLIEMIVDTTISLETFSNCYAFVESSIQKMKAQSKVNQKPFIYISLGTVLNDNKKCIKAFQDEQYNVIISVGKTVNISQLGKIPPSIQIYPSVNQIKILSQTDVFLTHCGMNSVNEALYYGVPMVLFPQHSEENAVAIIVERVGAGLRLKHPTSKCIKNVH